MSLSEIQRDFLAKVQGDGDDACDPGMRVYRNNYRAQLIECLESSFERTRAWIGADAFRDMVFAHLARVPPSSWTLDAYPRDFPDTLARQFPNDPEVPELAWIELALAEAFVAPDAEAIDAASMGSVDWDRAVLHITPSLDIAEAHSNATEIWAALADEQNPPAAEMLDETAAVLVWRRDERAHFRSATAREAQFLALARSGQPFARLCEIAVEALGEREGIGFAGAMLGNWLRDGLVTGVTIGERGRR